MPLQSRTNDIKNNTRKSATLYANLQVKTRRQEKSGTSDVKKATRQNTILYGNLQEKCRYQKKSGTSDTKKSGTSDAKKKRHKRTPHHLKLKFPKIFPSPDTAFCLGACPCNVIHGPFMTLWSWLAKRLQKDKRNPAFRATLMLS